MKRFRKIKNRKMKSVEIELSEWVKFNEKNEQEQEVIKDKGTKEISGGMKKRERVREPKAEVRTAGEDQEAIKDSRRELPRGEQKQSGSWETKKDYVLVRREQIRTAAEEMEQVKKEYRVLAEYHNDINLLQELPDQGTDRIQETAKVILRLQNDRKAYQEDMTRLDDGKYMQLSQYTEDMPGVIRRLTEDEMYVSRLKAEIDRLEGEKGEQHYESQNVEANQGRMKNLSIFCMFSLLALFAVLVILQVQYETDTQVFTLLCGIAFAAVTLSVFIRYFNNVNKAKTVENQLNKIIKKQNKAKIKYVNAKNGVDYVYRKYSVHSASELLFQWEQFIVAQNAREKFQHAGNEIIYYTKHLQKLLEKYRIQDAGMWMGQLEYLADEQQLNELKKELEDNIEQSKVRIENYRRVMAKAKDDISLLAIRNPEYAAEIKELTDLSEMGIEVP
ncbi:MAG: hypothetical protein HFI75_07035 [Lachnospiraceae bacterium]|nr:hypothetical protein [Lachnospiraceae bacterium]